jgi:hypothetical protein
MELLLTILFWIAAVIAGLVALPFVMIATFFVLGLLAFMGIAALFGSVILTITTVIFLADLVRPVTSWFKRTAGCK